MAPISRAKSRQNVSVGGASAEPYTNPPPWKYMITGKGSELENVRGLYTRIQRSEVEESMVASDAATPREVKGGSLRSKRRRKRRLTVKSDRNACRKRKEVNRSASLRFHGRVGSEELGDCASPVEAILKCER